MSSVAICGEGTQNLLCAYLAAAVLVGLIGNALFGLWWLDPLAALVVAGVALGEGVSSSGVGAATRRYWSTTLGRVVPVRSGLL